MLQTSGSVEVGGSFDLGSALEAIVVAAVVATDIVVTPLLIVVLPAKGAGLPSIEVERPHSIAFGVLVGLDIRVKYSISSVTSSNTLQPPLRPIPGPGVVLKWS